MLLWNTAQVKLKQFGGFLSSMVMPNIGAFIAWGLITALFIPAGWLPNEHLAKLVTPMINYLLPILIAYTGGVLIYGKRGGVVGALAAVGVIAGADVPMFLGAMIMGPMGGVVIKSFDHLIMKKVHPNFEVLVLNFSAGILGGTLTILSYIAIGPFIQIINSSLAAGMNTIILKNILPVSALLLEPAKVLFLNNAVDLGILAPLGIQQAAASGKSVLFLLITNPGPGLGLLLAYCLRGGKKEKQSAPGAIIIHLLGGIHEIYFPYVLMNPLTIIGVIAGGIAGTSCFTFLHAGLIATPSPGSIFALLAMTPKGSFFGVIAGVAVSAIVSFLVSSLFIKNKK